MKVALAAASLVLVVGGAAGCGGDDGDLDKGASTKEFCGAFEAFLKDLTGLTAESDDIGKVLKDAAKEIRDVGTPDDISDDAKEGLELTLDAIDELADDAKAEDIQKMGEDLSEAEKKKTDAFEKYLDKKCPDVAAD